MGGGGKGKKSYTVGYRYYAGFQAALCMGPITAVTEIKVGDKTASDASHTPGRYYLNQPGLHGGEDREGGVQGSFEVFAGTYAQSRSSYLVGQLGNDIPAFRGVASFVWEGGLLSCMNPYIKPWSFQVRKQAENLIVGSPGVFENPVNILADCITNVEWGLGHSRQTIDTNNFAAIGKILNDEGFGLCPLWTAQQSFEDFLQNIMDTIDGALYMDMVTGLWKIKLFRDDTDEAAMITLSEDDIVALTDFTRPSSSEIINAVTVKFIDYTTGKEQAVTEHDIAGITLAGGMINSATLEYPAIPTASLARRVALREVSQLGRGLATFNCQCTRKAAGLQMGESFILSYGPLGIDKMICRVKDINIGKSDDWTVNITAIEDAFKMPQTSLKSDEPGWTPPNTTPVSITGPVYFELPYGLVALWITEDADSAWSDLGEGWGFFATVAKQPGGLTIGYNQWVRQSDNQYYDDRTVSFNDWFVLAGDMDDITAAIPVAAGQAGNLAAQTLAMIDNEMVLISSMNANMTEFAIVRGCLDTVPAAHVSGATIWMVSSYDSSNPRQYLNGQQVYFRLPTQSPTETQDVSGLTTYNLTFKNRGVRPIPPGNIKLDGVYRPKEKQGGPGLLTWARRAYKDTAAIRAQTDPDVQPEAGTQTKIQVQYKDSAAAANWTTAGTVTLASEAATSFLINAFFSFPNAAVMRLTITSTRDGLDSTYSQVLDTKILSIDFKGFVSTSLPSTPAKGDVHILSADYPTVAYRNQIAIFRSATEAGAGSWTYTAPKQGLIARDTTDGLKQYTYTGSAWEG